MSIDFESKTNYGDDDDKCIKTRIKTNKDSTTTNFYNKKELTKVSEEKIPHECLYEKYYPQIFLEECKYMKENIKNKNYIDMELEYQNLIVIVIFIWKKKFKNCNNNK